MPAYPVGPNDPIQFLDAQQSWLRIDPDITERLKRIEAERLLSTLTKEAR